MGKKKTKKEKKEILNKRIDELYKSQGNNVEFVKKVLGVDRIKIQKIIELCNKKADEGRKRFTEKLKNQEWYQVKCPYCKISNRDWVDSGRDVYNYPIKYAKEDLSGEGKVSDFYMKVKFMKNWVKLVYHCRICKNYFA